MPNNIRGNELSNSAILVAQYFPPLNIIAAQRALRMARVLLKNFNVVYVITQPSGNLRKKYIDLDVGAEVLTNNRLHLISAMPLLSGYGYVEKPNILHKLVGALLTRMFCSTGADWVFPLSKAFKRIAEMDKVNLVISTGGPFIPFLAVTNFANRWNSKCIIDYRDLWSQHPSGTHNFVAKLFIRYAFERYINKRCTMLTTVSDGCRFSLLETNQNLKVSTLLNTPDTAYVKWFRELSAKNKLDKKYLNIVLTGTIYPSCTCGMLVRSIVTLPKNLRKLIKFHYYGVSADIIKKDFSNSEIESNLISHGFVGKAEAIAAVKNADILISLVYDSTESNNCTAINGVMTTKVFDYFLSGRPIINIGPDNADLNRFADNIGYAEFHSFDRKRETELSAYLLNAISNLEEIRSRSVNVELPDFGFEFEQILRSV